MAISFFGTTTAWPRAYRIREVSLACGSFRAPGSGGCEPYLLSISSIFSVISLANMF